MGITSQNHLGLGLNHIKYQTWIIHYPTFHQTSSTDWFARFAAMLELELYCCFFSRFVVHQILLCSNAFFFSRFVAYQIVLQCMLFLFLRLVVHEIVPQRTKSCHRVLFFTACRASDCIRSCSNAPNRASMRAFFFAVLSCTKSCCMVSIMLKVHHALVIILFML